nr:retrovirus-related Pol polyprotein from transposon TNT 1-94 [Tanacetum cinerariifolium]
MHVDLKYVESLEKEIDKLESDKAEFSNMYDTILQECVYKDVMCSYLLSLSDLDALDELQCLYLHKVKECDCLAQKLSNQTESDGKEVCSELLKRFAKVEKPSISLEISLKKCKEQGKSVDTKFDKPSVVRQPNAQRITKPSVLAKPVPFSNSLERIYFSTTKPVPKTNVSKSLSKPVTAHTLPKTTRQTVSNTNVLKPGMYRIDNRDLQGNDLLTGNRGSDLYTISLQGLTSSTPLCLMAKATPTQAWLWHRRLSYLNFDYINLLSKKDIVIGLPKLKYVKDQLCSSCELSKAKRSSFKSKAVPSSKGSLNLLHMDLCGPMRVASINGKKYILRAVAIASAQKNKRSFEAESIVRAASTRVRFRLSTTPFCSADAHVPLQQELDLLFSPVYDEFFNADSNPQDKQPTTNIQPTSPPSTHTYVHAEENNDN